MTGEAEKDASAASEHPRFVERIKKRGRPAVPRPLISVESISTADLGMAEHREAIRVQFQALLDKLAGGRCESPEENKRIARLVAELADRSGLHLISKGRIVTFRWNGGVFVAQATVGKKEMIDSNAGFLHLQAHPKILDMSLFSALPASEHEAEQHGVDHERGKARSR